LFLIFVGNRKLLKCNDVWANFIEHYGRRGCVVDCEKYPPQPQERKKKKKSRRVQEMDEFYRNTENDQTAQNKDEFNRNTENDQTAQNKDEFNRNTENDQNRPE
jgi:hypothetical protein